MTRIQPLTAPYEPATAELLASMMPEGAPPISLFRTFARNVEMTRALTGWGGYELGATLSLTLRDREILIDRTCALCRCEYEWGVHIAFFADAAALTPAQVTSLTHGDATDSCWTSQRDRLLVEAADELHNTAAITDALYIRLSDTFTDAELLDLFMLCGWYHAISYAANGAGVELEDAAPRFNDYATS